MGRKVISMGGRGQMVSGKMVKYPLPTIVPLLLNLKLLEPPFYTCPCILENCLWVSGCQVQFES